MIKLNENKVLFECNLLIFFQTIHLKLNHDINYLTMKTILKTLYSNVI